MSNKKKEPSISFNKASIQQIFINEHHLPDAGLGPRYIVMIVTHLSRYIVMIASHLSRN
jgi:hypothetical protein